MATRIRSWLVLPVVAFAATALTSCNLNLFSFSPTITFSVQNPYTSTQISIGYNIPTNSTIFNSGGSTDVLVTLEKHIAGTYVPLQQYESTMGTSGNLPFNLVSAFSNQISAFSYIPYDGTYLISMQVMSGGKPIPGYYGQQTFTVDTSGGKPTITEITPGLLPSTITAQVFSIVISGYHFSPTSTVTATLNTGSGSVTGTSWTVRSSTEIDASVSVSISSLTTPTAISVTVSDASGVSTPFILTFGSSSMSLTSTVPSSASAAGNTDQIILVYGTYLSPFTTITMDDSAGHSIAVSESVLQGQSLVSAGASGTGYYPITSSGMIPIYANLSGAAQGTATITATNPDGTSATIPFTIN